MAADHDPHYFKDSVGKLPAVLEFNGPDGWCFAVRAAGVWKQVGYSEGHNMAMANGMVEQDTFCATVAEAVAVHDMFSGPAPEGADDPTTNRLWASW